MPEIGEQNRTQSASVGMHNILRIHGVKAKTGLSRATIYARVKANTFPRPVSLGGRAVGWIESEVDAWLILCITQRNNRG